MTLTLNYRGQTNLPVEVEGILPEVVRAKSLEEIERLPILHGNRKLPLAEFFTITGDPGDARMAWEGDLAGVHWIGAKMTTGEILVAGDAGRHLGSEMRGGEIRVEGNAGDWTGSEMHGGIIHIRGSAGDSVGGAFRGSPRGMTRGTIVVHGSVGNELGHTMRRGLIAVGGDCGEVAGFNLIAGNIFVFGTAGSRPGGGMRRGTLAVLGEKRPQLLPSFRFACEYRPPFFPLLARQLANFNFKPAERLHELSVQLFHGDLVALGRGEVLLTA